MMSSAHLLLLLLLLLVCTVYTVSANNKKAKPLTADVFGREKSVKQPLPPGLPDLDNPEVYRQLKCSVCRSVGKSIREELRNQFPKPNTKPSEMQIAVMTDGLCEKLAALHGIYQPERLPNQTPDEEKSPDKGYWVNAYFINACSEVLDEHEDHLMEKFRDDETLYLMAACPSYCFRAEREALERGKRAVEKEKKEKELKEEEESKKKTNTEKSDEPSRKGEL
eukprot:PhM_4_TR15780/c0_g1_i1/m.100737